MITVTIPTWAIVVLVVVVLEMVTALVVVAVVRRPRKVRVLQSSSVSALGTSEPVRRKCHTATYRYADGVRQTVHSICDGDGRPHDDAYGQALRPTVPLVETIGGVHSVEMT